MKLDSIWNQVVIAMDHNAGPRVACVTLLTMLLVFLLSAIAIVLRLDDRTAGALRAALACLIFAYLAYLLFEVKVLQLLFSLLHLAPGQQPHRNMYYPPPPLSLVGTFSLLGSSVGRGLSPEEAGGGRASPSPLSEAGYMTSDSEHVPEPSPYFVSGGGYYRRRLSTRTRRSSRRFRTSVSSSSSSSSQVTEAVSDEESWMDGSSVASRSSSRAGGTMAYTKLLKRASKR